MAVARWRVRTASDRCRSASTSTRPLARTATDSPLRKIRFAADGRLGQHRAAGLVAAREAVDGHDRQRQLPLERHAEGVAAVVELAQAQLQLVDPFGAGNRPAGHAPGGPGLRDQEGVVARPQGSADPPRSDVFEQMDPIGHLEEGMAVVAGAVTERGQRLGEGGVPGQSAL